MLRSDALYTRANGGPVCHCPEILGHKARRSSSTREESSAGHANGLHHVPDSTVGAILAVRFLLRGRLVSARELRRHTSVCVYASRLARWFRCAGAGRVFLAAADRLKSVVRSGDPTRL